jgi:protease I
MARLDGLRVAALTADGFEEAVLTEPVRALQAAGAHVEIVAPHAGEIQGLQEAAPGRRLTVDRVLHAARPEEYDALLLPGGALSADALRMRAEVQAFVRDVHQAGKPIAAICHAPWVLISAGLVPGRTLTSHFSVQDDVRNAGGAWVDRAIVEDGNWLTSRDEYDLEAFLPALVDFLARAARAARRAASA